MPVGLPAGQKMEIEFTAGVWTDVSVDVQFEMGVPITIGRQTVFSVPSVGQMTVTLDNTSGRYTPQRQLLADGVTVHPYYPNVLPRKRIRYSHTPGGVRFLGYIKSFPPSMENGVRGFVTLTAFDRLKLLDKVTLQPPVPQEYSQDAPVVYWPLGDPVNSLTVVERLGGAPLAPVGAGAAPTFGAAGVVGDTATATKFTPGGAASGQYLRGQLPSTLNLTAFTLEVWVNAGTVAPAWGGSGQNIVGFDDAYGNYTALIYMVGGGVGFVAVNAPGGTGLSASILDGKFHHVAVTRTTANGNATLYVDGVVVGSTTSGSFAGTAPTTFTVGESASPNTYAADRFQGTVQHVALYPTALSAPRIASHYAAGIGYASDTTGGRVARWLPAAGLTASDWTLDTGVNAGVFPQAGVSVLAACQAMADTESSGSVFYINSAGSARFTDRNNRVPAAPVMTFDAAADLLGSPFAPDFSDEGLYNTSVVTRANSTGTLSVQTYTDAASAALFQPSTDQVTVYSATDLDALQVGQWRVAANRTPGYRLPQVAVDMAKSTSNFYTALASLQIGSRIRVTSLPAVAGPAAQMDFLVEGWTETPHVDSYIVQFDLSAADVPPQGVWDDAVYGRWQASGATLNATITPSATSLAIVTTTGPTWSTAAGDYPLSIVVNQEIIQLNSAPSGSTSPQTFTGVTRGVSGTTAAAQTAGSAVDVYQTATFGL